MKFLRQFSFVILVVSACSSGVFADEIDSLKNVIAKLPDDSNKVNTLNELSKQLLNTDPKQTIEYATKAANLAHKIGYIKGEAYAYKFIGISQFNSGDNLETLKTWQHSLDLFKSISFKKGIANLLSNIGNIYYNQGDEENALVYFYQSLKIAEEIKDTVRLSTVYINIGSMYSNRPFDYDKAIKYYKLAMGLSIATHDDYILGNNEMNLGEVYYKQGKIDTALNYFISAVTILKGTDGYSYALNSLANAYMAKKDFDKAILYHQQAYDDAKKLDGNLDMATSLRGMGEVYLEQKKYSNSRAALLSAEGYALKVNGVNELKEIYKLLVQVSAGSNYYKSGFVYQQKLMDIKDTIYSIDKDKKLGSLQFEFDIQKQKGQIDLLQKDQELNEHKIQQQKN